MPASGPSSKLLRPFLSRRPAVAAACTRPWGGGRHHRHHVVRPPPPPLAWRRGLSSSPPSSSHALRELFQRLASGEVTVDEAEGHMKLLGSDFERLGDYAKLDHDRAKRTGVPEVVFGQGKTAAQIAAILQNMYHDQRRQMSKGQEPSVVMVTRLTEAKYEEVCKILKGKVSKGQAPASTQEEEEVGPLLNQLDYNPVARIASIVPKSRAGDKKVLGSVAVLCAGTADLSVAEEVAVVAELCQCQVHRAYDVGVAGIHRLFRSLQTLRDVQVVVCVAGMDGALPTVVAGLVMAPVIAVPTSVGYGVGKDGMAPLMTMLNGCAPGLAVVNIDNGFGAATMAVKILKAIQRGGSVGGSQK